MKKEIIDLTANLFSNGTYDVMDLKKKEESKPSREDQVFYRKRIVRILKDMLKGERSCERLQRLHDNYVSGIIDFIQEHDTTIERQKNYGQVELIKNSPTNKGKSSFRSSTILRNREDIECLGNRDQRKTNTLHNFVSIKSGLASDVERFPEIRTINLKSKANRTKATELTKI